MVFRWDYGPSPTETDGLLSPPGKGYTPPTDHLITGKKVQVGKDQEKAQSEKDSHSKNRGGKKPN